MGADIMEEEGEEKHEEAERDTREWKLISLSQIQIGKR